MGCVLVPARTLWSAQRFTYVQCAGEGRGSERRRVTSGANLDGGGGACSASAMGAVGQPCLCLRGHHRYYRRRGAQRGRRRPERLPDRRRRNGQSRWPDIRPEPPCRHQCSRRDGKAGVGRLVQSRRQRALPLHRATRWCKQHHAPLMPHRRRIDRGPCRRARTRSHPRRRAQHHHRGLRARLDDRGVRGGRRNRNPADRRHGTSPSGATRSSGSPTTRSRWAAGRPTC